MHRNFAGDIFGVLAGRDEMSGAQLDQVPEVGQPV